MADRRLVLALGGLAAAGIVAVALSLRPSTSSRAGEGAGAEAGALAFDSGGGGVGAREFDSARRAAADDPAERERSRGTWGPDAPPQLEVPQEEPPPAIERPTVSSEPPGTPPVAREVDKEREARFAALQERATEQAAEALDGMRSGLRDACWPGGKGSASFEVDLSFDAGGKLQAAGISDARGADPAVGACLRAQPLPVEIDPPGESVAVKVPIRLP